MAAASRCRCCDSTARCEIAQPRNLGLNHDYSAACNIKPPARIPAADIKCHRSAWHGRTIPHLAALRHGTIEGWQGIWDPPIRKQRAFDQGNVYFQKPHEQHEGQAGEIRRMPAESHDETAVIRGSHGKDDDRATLRPVIQRVLPLAMHPQLTENKPSASCSPGRTKRALLKGRQLPASNRSTTGEIARPNGLRAAQGSNLLGTGDETPL